MKREAVESSSVATIGYDGVGRVLEVQFHNGGIYQYLDVPRAVHVAFREAPSRGRYFNAEVRNHFEWRRVGGP